MQKKTYCFGSGEQSSVEWVRSVTHKKGDIIGITK